MLGLADGAGAYAGGGELKAIDAPRELTAVDDGETVFDLESVETPGHTPGHVSVLDPAGSQALIAGDALTADQQGNVAGPDPQFTADVPQAHDSRLGAQARQLDLRCGAGRPRRAGGRPGRHPGGQPRRAAVTPPSREPADSRLCTRGTAIWATRSVAGSTIMPKVPPHPPRIHV